MSGIHKKDWCPGYRFFRCDCGYQWDDRSRDCQSPSGDSCPKCHEFCSPDGYETHYEWETDQSGNLK